MKIDYVFSPFLGEKMDTNINYSSSAYSWGEFYETMRKCDGYNKEEQKKFAVFEALDRATTFEEIITIISPLEEKEINWLNSPCLDGLILSVTNPEKFKEKEYLETWKFLLQKDLICVSIHELYPYKNIIWLLLQRGIDTVSRQGLSTVNKIKIDILEWAARKGYNDIINFLYLQDDLKDLFRNSYALDNASYHGHMDTVKLLLHYGADIHQREDGPFRHACRRKDTEMAKLLLENGANIHAVQDNSLRNSCANGNTIMVEFLLKNGADLHSEDDEPLQLACIYGYFEIVKLLIENGANIHAENDDALKHAVQYEHTNIVQFLLEHGANPNIIDIRKLQKYPEIREIFMKNERFLFKKQVLNESNKLFHFR